MSLGDTPTLVRPARPGERETVRFGRGAEAFVLLLLAQGPSYGYEIRRLLEEFDYLRADSDPGALYRLLRELEANQSISSRWDVAGSGPARRYYALTAQGHADLQRAAERMAGIKRRAERFLALYAELQARSPLTNEPVPTSNNQPQPGASA